MTKIPREIALNRTKEIIRSLNQVGENIDLIFDGRKYKIVVQDKKKRKQILQKDGHRRTYFFSKRAHHF